MTILDETDLGIPLPHPDNDPYAVDVDRIRVALTLLSGLIGGLQSGVADAATRIELDQAVRAAIAALVDDAPAALDTLREVAVKLSDNDDAVAALIAQIAAEVETRQVAIASEAQARQDADALKLNRTGDDPIFKTAKLAVYDLGVLTGGTKEIDWANGTRQKVVLQSGANVFSYKNLPVDGSGELEILATYLGGIVGFAQTIRWKPGDGTESTSFGSLALTLTAGVTYRHYVQYANGSIYGEWR